jgi:hypothetical protein
MVEIHDIIKLLLLILVLLLVGVSGFISVTGKIVEENNMPWSKRLTRKGKWFVGTSTAVIIASIGQYLYSDYLDNLKEENLKKSYQSSVKDITKVIMDYGYRYEAETKKLQKIVKDSSKTRITEKEQPVLYLQNIYQSVAAETPDVFTEFRLEMYSAQAGSENFNVELTIVLSDSLGGMRYLPNASRKHYLKSGKIPADKTLTTGFYVKNDILAHYKFILLYLTGTYTAIGGGQKQKIDEWYCYDLGKMAMHVLDLDAAPPGMREAFIKSKANIAH